MLLIAALLAAGAAGNAPAKNNLALGFDLDAGGTFLHDSASQREGVGNGFVLHLAGGVDFRRYFDARLEIGLGRLEDKRSFTQATTGGTMDSVVTEVSGSAALGAWMDRLGDGNITVRPGLRLGYELSSVTRNIANCTNCSTGDVQLKAGVFVQPSLKFYWSKDGTAVGLGFRWYPGNKDLFNRPLLTVGGTVDLG